MTSETKSKQARTKKTGDEPKRPKEPLFTIIKMGPTPVAIDFSECPVDQVSGFVFRTISNTYGHHDATAMNGVYSLGTLIDSYDYLSKHVTQYVGRDNLTKYREDWKDFLAIIKDYGTQAAERVALGLETGELEFSDIPFAFKDQEVYSYLEGEVFGGVVTHIERVRSFFGIYYKIGISTIHTLNGNAMSKGSVEMNVGMFPGKAPMSSLPIKLMTAEVKEQLQERGLKFFEYYKSGSHVQYKGQLTRSSWWNTNSYRADGRLMVDPSTFAQIDDEQLRSEKRNSKITGLDSYDDEPANATVTPHPEDMWQSYPFMFGFSFAAKQWGRVAVSGMSPIRWRDDAFDKLVLDADTKDLVRSLVENHTGSFEDIIEGKGGGIIFLLHGPPGQGKTLTAEAIAELLHKPLYSVSIGELGINPTELESALRGVLDIATVWDAVILIDEADIFLEERDEHDIVRNAMVGVFLRLLEYHQGVMFLTTNRVRNIDSAFYSRISIALHFKDGGVPKREKIWLNLLSAAQLDTNLASSLSSHELNGRQIKNVIRISQTLAKAENRPVTQNDLIRVMQETTEFQRSMAQDKKGFTPWLKQLIKSLLAR